MTSEPAQARVSANDVLRFFLELFAFVSLCLWGIITWPFPANIVAGTLAPLIAILLWALFRSPKAVFPIGVFGRAVVEIAVMASAALAWVGLGQPIVAIIFVIIATVTGIISGRKEIG